MSTKHTPGPWKWERMNGELWLRSENDHVLDAVGDDVCVSDADAALIAAAPDLLSCTQLSREMILSLISVFKLIDDRLEGQMKEIVATMDAVIAKAEGRS